eukprot:1155781-Rhodomonas_salina.1
MPVDLILISFCDSTSADTANTNNVLRAPVTNPHAAAAAAAACAQGGGGQRCRGVGRKLRCVTGR